MTRDEYFDLPPYSLSKDEKQSFLLQELNNLTQYHQQHSQEYQKILQAYGLNDKTFHSLEEFFALPVRVFKEHTLMSIEPNQVVKTLTSSGTTSQKVSKIYLDKETSTLQTKVLIKIMQNYLGKKRLPMLIIDSKDVLKNRQMFSARGAGILGLSNFGRHHTYALDSNMQLDIESIKNFIDRFKDEPIFIFGFTYMIWQYFYMQLKTQNIHLDLSNATLIHSGGWKKLINLAVDNTSFKNALLKQTQISKIHDFYGMVEQVGSIFVECEYGHLHTPIYSDIIIRDPLSLEPLPNGQEGIIEVLSILPKSYPGHILLTEDIGTILGEDDCSCGRKGKYFRVKGRLPKSELRGCSDTHAYQTKEEI